MKSYSIEYNHIEDDVFIVKYKDIEFEFWSPQIGCTIKKIRMKSYPKNFVQYVDTDYYYYYLKNPIICKISINYFIEIFKELDSLS